MNDHENTEARLRAALASRADAVEPATGAELVGVLGARAVDARRRRARQRVLLSVAALILVVAGITGVLVVVGGDGEQLDTADDPPAPNTTGSTVTTALDADQGAAIAGLPALWPLPTMSVSYATPEEAAAAFWTGYLGFGIDDCLVPAQTDADIAVAGICGVEGEEILLRHDDVRGWVVVGAEAPAFDLTSPEAGGAHPPRIPIGLSTAAPVELEIRRLGELDALAGGEYGPGDLDLELGPEDEAPGPYVVIVRSRGSATVRSVVITGPPTTEAPTTTVTQPTTTTTTAPVDDGTVGWPGTSVGGFEDPGEAAVAFANEVLGFAETTVDSVGETGVVLRSRPTAGATTTVSVHDTGARGWVVTGATSSQGRIDTPVPGAAVDLPILVEGEATAFEATLTVQLLSLSGTAFATTFTMAGSNGEVGPFSTTIDPGPGANPVGGPTFVLIGEGDASGEGDLSWAAVVLVDL